MRDLSKIIIENSQAYPQRTRQAKVISIQSGPPTTITAEINGVNYSGVSIMTHVSPVVGEGVWILDMGSGRWIATGTTMQDSGWVSATLLNSWVNFGFGFASARYRKARGIVSVEGLIKSGTLGAVAFQMPVGMRPTGGQLMFAGIGGVNDVARFDIAPDGSVIPQTGNTGYYTVTCSFLVD